jgi:TPR repeat protein
VHWFRQAAESGDAGGQMGLASCLQSGEGVARNEAEAFEWWRKAAAHGVAEAEFHLGRCFQNGLGTDVNETDAMRCFQAAAEKSLPQAEFETGLCHRHGRGTEVDLPEAFAWFSLATRRAIPNAREMCEELQAEMTPEQIEEGTLRLNRLAAAQPHAPSEQAAAAQTQAGLKIPSA